MDKDIEKYNYTRKLRLFVQRLIKMAKEQIVVGRNYGWTQDSMAEELHLFIQEELRQALKSEQAKREAMAEDWKKEQIKKAKIYLDNNSSKNCLGEGEK